MKRYTLESFIAELKRRKQNGSCHPFFGKR